MIFICKFLGGGLTAEINLNIPFRRVDWRVIGIKMTALYEGGSYAKFRDKAVNKSVNLLFDNRNIKNLNPENIGLNISGSSEVILKLNNLDLGLWMTLGFGHQVITHGIGTYVTKNRFTGFLKMNSSVHGASLIGTRLAYQIR